MNDSPFTKKGLFWAGVFSLLVVGLIIITSFFDSRTKIVFCDVGQGDSTYIRIKNRFDVLIDAGPNNKVLSCLGKYVPFYDRKIELAILSHPDKDHYFGFLEIIKRYQIDNFVMTKTDSGSQTFTQLKQTIKNHNIKLIYVTKDDSFNIINDRITFLWPDHIYNTNDDNINSLVFLFKQGGFRALFTGDASSYVLNRLSKEAKSSIMNLSILKIPHHGSKNSLVTKFLQLAKPGIAVITVGKNNSYGHPSKDVLDYLKALNIKTKRTDKDGDILFYIKN